jgi:hypothetical protein
VRVIPPWQVTINENENPRDNDDTMIFLRGSLACRKLRPHCSDSPHLEFHALIGITRLTRDGVLHNQHKMGIRKLRAIK